MSFKNPRITEESEDSDQRNHQKKVTIVEDTDSKRSRLSSQKRAQLKATMKKQLLERMLQLKKEGNGSSLLEILMQPKLFNEKGILKQKSVQVDNETQIMNLIQQLDEIEKTKTVTSEEFQISQPVKQEAESSRLSKVIEKTKKELQYSSLDLGHLGITVKKKLFAQRIELDHLSIMTSEPKVALSINSKQSMNQLKHDFPDSAMELLNKKIDQLCQDLIANNLSKYPTQVLDQEIISPPNVEMIGRATVKESSVFQPLEMQSDEKKSQKSDIFYGQNNRLFSESPKTIKSSKQNSSIQKLPSEKISQFSGVVMLKNEQKDDQNDITREYEAKYKTIELQQNQQDEQQIYKGYRRYQRRFLAAPQQQFNKDQTPRYSYQSTEDKRVYVLSKDQTIRISSPEHLKQPREFILRKNVFTRNSQDQIKINQKIQTEINSKQTDQDSLIQNPQIITSNSFKKDSQVVSQNSDRESPQISIQMSSIQSPSIIYKKRQRVLQNVYNSVEVEDYQPSLPLQKERSKPKTIVKNKTILEVSHRSRRFQATPTESSDNLSVIRNSEKIQSDQLLAGYRNKVQKIQTKNDLLSKILAMEKDYEFDDQISFKKDNFFNQIQTNSIISKTISSKKESRKNSFREDSLSDLPDISIDVCKPQVTRFQIPKNISPITAMEITLLRARQQLQIYHVLRKMREMIKLNKKEYKIMQYHKFIEDHKLKIQPQILAQIEDNIPAIEYLDEGLKIMSEMHEFFSQLKTGHHNYESSFALDDLQHVEQQLSFLNSKYDEVNHPAYQADFKILIQKAQVAEFEKSQKIDKLRREKRVLEYNIRKLQQRKLEIINKYGRHQGLLSEERIQMVKIKIKQLEIEVNRLKSESQELSNLIEDEMDNQNRLSIIAKQQYQLDLDKIANYMNTDIENPKIKNLETQVQDFQKKTIQQEQLLKIREQVNENQNHKIDQIIDQLKFQNEQSKQVIEEGNKKMRENNQQIQELVKINSRIASIVGLKNGQNKNKEYLKMYKQHIITDEKLKQLARKDSMEKVRIVKPKAKRFGGASLHLRTREQMAETQSVRNSFYSSRKKLKK